MTAPGTTVTIPNNTTTASPHKPRWLEWDGTAAISSVLKGAAELPSGYKRFATARVRTLIPAYNYNVRTVSVDPVALPADPGTPWRCIVYAPDGTYAVMDGLPGSIPTVGTPRVRLTDNGPSRAVVRIPVTAKILSASFSGWSDGHAEAVTRGMEMTVEYRTPDGTLTLVFRGRIFEAESGEYVTLTAYDRLMDLALFSDQYLPPLETYSEDEVSLDRDVNGTTYTYVMSSSVGQVNTAYPVDHLRIDCLSAQDINASWMPSNLTGVDGTVLIHALPSYSHTEDGVTTDYGVEEGRIIRRLAAKVGWETSSAGDYTLTVTFHIYRVSGGTFTSLWSGSATVPMSSASADQREVSVSPGFTATDPSTLYVGISLSWDYPTGTYNGYAVVDGDTSKATVDASSYYQFDGSSWASWQTEAASRGPELAVDFDWIDTASDVAAALTVSGSSVSLDSSSIPTISAGYVSTVNAGVGIDLSYFVTDAIALEDVVEDLIEGAGMKASISSSLNLGTTTYYTSATYDYLTCIHELIRSADAGIRDSLTMPGTVSVLPRHTVDEAARETFSTDPMDGSEQSIVSHSLTARWMAERATVAILAENATASGLPIALETDDWLMENSLVEGIGSPMRSVTADNTSGTHRLLANAAGGKVVQLHTNVVEGSVVLAGYRPDLWDLDGTGEGGLPIALTVPEYGIEDTVVVPTELEIADGVTSVTLDNVRRADRSEVANSMSLTADAIGTASTTLPDTVWIFARADMSYLQEGGGKTPLTSWTIKLYNTNGAQVGSAISGPYLKFVKDSAGYWHALGVIPASETALASDYPIGIVAVSNWAITDPYPVCAALDNPKYALAGQNVHVDIRLRAR